MFRAVNLSVQLTSLVGKFQQITRLRSRVQVTPVELFQDFFLRACYSVAPNGLVHEFKKEAENEKEEEKRKMKRKKKGESEHNASVVLVVC